MRRLRLFLPLIALSFLAQAPALQKPVVIVLVGPPSSGKSTQAGLLNRRFRLPVIAAEDLRKVAGQAASDEALNRALRAQLSKTDTSRGFVLDGYPASRAQADHLADLVRESNLPSPLIVQLDVPDNVVHSWAAQRKGPADSPDNVKRLLRRYHDEMDLLRSYYPEGDIWTIDGTRPPAEVSATIRTLLADRK